MKKENRKLAKERKAREKKKLRQAELLKKGLLIAIPLLLIAIALWALGRSDQPEPQNDITINNTVNNEDSATDYPSLQTDTSLVVADGDTVNIDYVGTIDGVEFAGGSTGGMGADLTIGSGMYIDDFEQQLIGYNVGDTVEVVVTFPDNYGAEDLNGQEAVFTTVINGIYK